MKISKIHTHRMILPNARWIFVEIITDTGKSGWGEATDSCDEFGLANLIEEESKQLIGKNPEDVMACTDEYFHWKYPSRKIIRTYATAWSALDQALWDLSAQSKNMPLWKALGGRNTKKIPLYANLNNAIRNDRRPEALAQNGQKALSQGFKMIKCTPFDEINPSQFDASFDAGFERFDALMQYADIKQVSIDCHQRFERHNLARMCEKLLSEYGTPYWLEDPVDIQDFETMHLMNKQYPQIRWAAGEDALHLKAIYTTMKSGCYEVLMPDVKFIGGDSAVRALIPMAEETGFAVSMHNPNGPISTAHSAHLMTLCRKNVPLEYPFASVANRELLTTPTECVKDGYYHLNDEIGLGIKIADTALREYGETFINGRFCAYSTT
ncbi:MAG: mandelate racemase/muconate lactonizing enzyme family protein [Oscillospiraceae bacterium]